MSTHCTKDFQKFPSHVCLCEFEANLDYTVNSKIARAIQGNLVLERKRKKKKKENLKIQTICFYLCIVGISLYLNVHIQVPGSPVEGDRFPRTRVLGGYELPT